MYKNYYLVYAVFTSEQNAENYEQYVRQNGFKVKIERDGLFRIVSDEFYDLDTAKEMFEKAVNCLIYPPSIRIDK